MAAATAHADAVTGAQRLKLPALAAAPTLTESGLTDFNVSVWHALDAPRDTPPPVLVKLNDALRAALQDPELIKARRRWASRW